MGNINLINKMTLKDLKRNAIIRGLAFDQVCEMSIIGLTQWLMRHWANQTDKKLLNDYDTYVNKVLMERGAEDLINPAFDLGYMDVQGKDTKKIKGLPREKKKIEKVNGVRAGTKKALTVELTKKGLPKVIIAKRVMKAFPDANIKSINIWIKRALKQPKK